MEFCNKCGSLMTVKKKHTRSFMVCSKCGKERPLKKEKLILKENLSKDKKKIIVMGKGVEAMEFPKTRIICPKCENAEAYWWMQQTRSADEAATIFYRCLKCSHNWRSYG